jgi:hypothetical protein
MTEKVVSCPGIEPGTFRRDIPESSLRVFNQTYFVIIDFVLTP